MAGAVARRQEQGLAQPNRAPPHAPPTRPTIPCRALSRAVSGTVRQGEPITCAGRTPGHQAVPSEGQRLSRSLLRVRRASTYPATAATRWRMTESALLLTV